MRTNSLVTLVLGAGLLALNPLAQAASNLVFCSEGSPAGFDPGPVHGRHRFRCGG